MKSNLKIGINEDRMRKHSLQQTGNLCKSPIYYYVIFFILGAFNSSLFGQSVQFKSSDGGNRIIQQSTCKTCTNNLIANPKFQNGIRNWTILIPKFNTISYDADAGATLCSTKGGGLSQTVKGIAANQQYRFLVNAKKNGMAKCWVNIQFLDEKAHPVDTMYNQEIRASEFEPIEISIKAPMQAKMARVGIWGLAGACMSVDDWCLVQTEDPEAAIKVICEGQVPPRVKRDMDDEVTLEESNSETIPCLPNTKELEGTFQARPERVYTLKVKAKAYNEQPNTLIGFIFLDNAGKRIGNPVTQLVYAPKYQLYTLVAVAPMGTRSIRVRSMGKSCVSIEDWCITSRGVSKLHEDTELAMASEHWDATHLTEIKAYPNPAKDRFWLLLPASFADFQEAKLVVTDALGKVLLSKSILGEELSGALEISTVGLNTGVYLVSIVPLHQKPMTTQVVVTK